MATGKVIGQIQVTQGNVKIVSVDGSVREPKYDGFVYENEQIISNDPKTLFQIKFLALPEASAYDGVFRILADGSVIHGRDAIDSVASDESLVNILKTAAAGEDVKDLKTAGTDVGDLETAAGEEGVESSSSFTETDIVAESSVLGFSRGANGALGFGITEFGSRANYDVAQITPPAITSPNVVVYDENGTQPVIQITATGESAVTYSISGLDSDKFSIDGTTGLLTFNSSPDYENPQDLSGDNEYNMYVTATDTNGNYTTQLLSVSVNNINEAVTAINDTVDAVEDTVLSSTIDLDANDTDLDGDALSVVAGTYTTAQGGSLVVAADGSYTYTPPANFHGVDSVNYTVTDGEFSDVGTLTINVAPVNDAPVAVDDAVNAVEDTVLSSTIDLDANDYDIDGDALSVVAGTFATANGGQLVLASDGTYTYTPAANFNGIDTVDYTVTDGELIDVGTLTINVAAVDDTPPIVIPPVNNAPVANEDSGIAAEDGSVVVDILANDTDLDGTIDPTTVVITTNPTNGTVVVNPTRGEVTYTPNANYNGSDSFAYTVQDNEGATSSPATVSLNVTPVNDAPVAVDDTISTQEDTVLSSVIDLDANDTDLDGDDLSVVAGTFTTAQGGSLVVAADGSYTYTPPVNFNGVDSVDYTVTDGELTDVGTLTINVVPVNDAPVAVDDEVNAIEDTVFTSTIDLDANDTDVSGDALSVMPGTFATTQGGEIVIAMDGSYTYTPPTNFNGVDTVNYTVTDGSLTDVGTLTINVAPANDVPSITVTANNFTEDSGVAAGATAGTYTTSDSDVGDILTVSFNTSSTHYILDGGVVKLTQVGVDVINAGGTLDAIDLRVTDAAGAFAIDSDTPVVTPVNDAPVANDDTAETQEDTAITLSAADVLGNDTDSDGGTLTITAVDNAVNGNVVLNPNGTITFTPTSNYHGGASFDYTISDGQGGTSTATATVNVTVTPVDDATTLTIVAGTAIEDTTVSGDTVATFSVSDTDETPTVGFTSGTNDAGYYAINGNNIVLTAVGEAFLDGGGTLPTISLTTSGTSTDITATATPTTIAAADALINVTSAVGAPLFNLADFSINDDENSDPAVYQSNGLIITSTSGYPLLFNPGNGLGIDSGHSGDEPKNIDGAYGEALDIKLPSAVYALNIDIKHTANDLIGIELYNGTQIITSSDVTFKDSDGNTLTLTSGGYIDGDDLNSGNALDTIKVISTTTFDKIVIKDADISSNQDGFTLVNIYDPQSISGYYTYDYNMAFDLKEIDEAVQSITLSGFNPLIDNKLVFSGSINTEISDVGGVITITDSALINAINGGTVDIVLASQNEIAADFEPVFDAITVDSPSTIVAHTILGGSGDDIALSGGMGNDYIDGRTGNDTILGNNGNDTLTGGSGTDNIDGGSGTDTVYGGTGNDTIAYDAVDVEIDGGAGVDTLIGNSEVINLSNVSGIEVIQLSAGTTVVGSGVNGINAADVINSTDSGTLIIQSADSSPLNQVSVDESSLTPIGNVTIDGIDYAQYTGIGGATLLIELNDNIVVD